MLSRALRNKTAEDFRFTMKGDTLTKSIEEIYDATAFQNTLIALETVGFDSTLQQQIFEIVSGILYLGEIDFTSIDSTSTTKICCELLGLGVDHQEELFACLSTKTTIIMNETFSSTTDAETSCKYRDALAKDMYRRLFNWLVHSLNEITSINTSAGLDPDARVGFVSLLDIFGFENFTVNHFEQLCINYANEKLQLKFIRDNIATTVEEYKNENLDWMDISFPDNTSVVELIECKRNPNLSNQEKVEKSPSTYSICIIGLLEEECVIPKGSDASFLRKMKSNCRSSASFVPLDKKLNEFAIDHFAARVTYDVTDFVESNRDITPHLSQNLVQSTSNSVLRTLYANSPQHEKAPDPPRNSNNLKSASTVITKFQKQLNELVGVLDNSVVQYVRCIKPNNLQSYDPADFDSPEVVQQLRSSGLIEAIQVSRSAYPYSIPLREFCTKHNPVLKLSDSTKKLLKSSSDHCTTIDCTMLSKLAETIVALSTDGPLTTRDYQIGKSKVFLSEATFQEVEKHTIILLDSLATVVQSKARSLQCRKAYLITLNNISFVQRLLRTKITRYKFLKMKRAARLIQRIYLKRKNDRLEKSVTDIQRIFRGWKGRLCYSKRWNALMILQRLAIRAITKQKSNDLSINLVMVTSDDWSDHSIASDLDLNAIEEMSLPRSDESFLISSDSCVVEVGKSVTFDQELLVLPSFGSGETCAFAPKTTLSFENMQSKLQIETNCSNSMDSEDTMNTVDIHSSIKHSPIKSFGSTCEQYEKKMDHDGWYQSYFSPQDNFWAYAMPSGSEMSALSPFPQCTQNLEPEDFQNIPRGMFSASDDFHISSDSASLAPQHGDHHFSASTNSFNNLQTSTVQQLIRQTQLISQVIRQMTPDTLNSNPTHHRVFTILIEGFVAFIILAMIQYMVLGELWDLMESWKWCDSEMIQYL